jgi:HK97 gp10 family phage protein
MGLGANIEGGLALRRNLHALSLMFPEVLRAANEATALEIVREAERNIRDNDSIASGDLLGSIQSSVSDDGLTVAVGSTSKYAPYVEFGTRPHWPPVSAIARWCVLKGIPVTAAFPIARKISEVGTPEQPFLRPAAKVASERHTARVKVMLQAALQRFRASK